MILINFNRSDIIIIITHQHNFTQLKCAIESMESQKEPMALESFPGISCELSTDPAQRLEETKGLKIAIEGFKGVTVIFLIVNHCII